MADGLELAIAATDSLRAQRAKGTIMLTAVHDPEPATSATQMWKVAALLLFALIIRLAYFSGLSYGDDVIYASQIIAHAENAAWPPEPNHWCTRLGLTLPTVALVKLFGMQPSAFLLLPLLASTLKVLVCLKIALHYVNPRTAYLAAIFQASFPLDVVFATHLFPDVLSGFYSTLSIWCWMRAIQDDRATDYFWSGAFFGMGYLCRETVIMDGAIYLALWLWAGRLARSRMLWVALVPALVILLELLLYATTAESPLYRWNAILSQMSSPDVGKTKAGGGFWSDPILLLFTSHEIGVHFALSLFTAVLAWWLWPDLRPLSIWMLVGFVWLYYGTAVPTGWTPLPREARYAAGLTVPSVILAAQALTLLGRRAERLVAVLIIASSLLCAGLDRGRTVLAPHRDFIRSPFANLDGVTLEPFDYVSARWSKGLTLHPGFACLQGVGRRTIVNTISALDDTEFREIDSSHFIVLAPGARPDLLEELSSRGWEEVAHFPERIGGLRSFAVRILELIPSQEVRVARIRNQVGLVVLRHISSPRSTQDGKVDTTVNQPARNRDLIGQ